MGDEEDEEEIVEEDEEDDEDAPAKDGAPAEKLKNAGVVPKAAKEADVEDEDEDEDD